MNFKSFVSILLNRDQFKTENMEVSLFYLVSAVNIRKFLQTHYPAKFANKSLQTSTFIFCKSLFSTDGASKYGLPSYNDSKYFTMSDLIPNYSIRLFPMHLESSSS